MGPLFTYGGPFRPGRLDAADTYAVLDFQTTGLDPYGSDRVIEVAVVRVEGGVVGEPWSTLIDPGRDVGASFVHHITDADVAGAPTFAAIAPYLLTLLSGAVVVAHSATFDEVFLAAELTRADHRALRMPALCTLRLAQRTFETPNHKLPTLARELGVPTTRNVSRDHVLATAAVLQHALAAGSVSHSCPPFVWPGAPVPPPRVVNRVVGLRKGSQGYMSSLLSKLPTGGAAADDAAQESYLDALTAAMADGVITREEAEQLGRIAGAAGMNRETTSALNAQLLEDLRAAALADDVLTAAELRDLKRAAKAPGAPTYFDGLGRTWPSGPARPAEPGWLKIALPGQTLRAGPDVLGGLGEPDPGPVGGVLSAGRAPAPPPRPPHGPARRPHGARTARRPLPGGGREGART